MSINIVILRPEIPHNTGAIGRLCVGLEAALHIIEPMSFSIDDATVKRCGLDYWQFVNVTVHKSWSEFIQSEQPEEMIFLSTKTSKSIYDYKFTSPAYLIFGNETSGLPEEFYEKYQDKLYTIPMPGKHARSINLANAASIAAYEAFRQIGN